MDNHYRVLGVNSSASLEEIRRAYRILARRYHPDVNPIKGSSEKFRKIAEAYEVLSDGEKRRQFDISLETQPFRGENPKIRAYRKSATRPSAQDRFRENTLNGFGKNAAPRPEDSIKPAQTSPSALDEIWKKGENLLKSGVKNFFKKSPPSERPVATNRKIQKISIIELSLTVPDAIRGVRKAIEIAEPEGSRKVSVNIPAGVRSGSVIRLRERKSQEEELVLVVRLAHHPYLNILNRGLVVELPITVHEAILGANISVPTLEEQLVIKVPAGSQSGSEIRLREKGIPASDGKRGDLFYRLMIRVPESIGAVGLKEKSAELDAYYESPVRTTFPRTLLE